ncbi:MAG: hypothetical protein ACI959_000435 [Limisphaerales bacterium]|jgi:hypothetical protein
MSSLTSLLNCTLKMNRILIILLIGAFCYSITSCKHDPTIPKDVQIIIDTTVVDTVINLDPCDPDSIYFENTILPLLNSSCAIPGCHDASTAEDGVILNDYLNIISTGEITPGDAFDSKLFEIITEDDPDDKMPPSGSGVSLTAEQIQLIFDWIQQGASNNGCSMDCDTSTVSFSLNILPIIQSNCTGCHSGSAPQAGITLNNYSTISGQALFGTLFLTLSGDGVTQMPNNLPALDVCNITLIKKWIDEGAPDN